MSVMCPRGSVLADASHFVLGLQPGKHRCEQHHDDATPANYVHLSITVRAVVLC